jgi:hypothetical protein
VDSSLPLLDGRADGAVTVTAPTAQKNKKRGVG